MTTTTDGNNNNNNNNEKEEEEDSFGKEWLVHGLPPMSDRDWNGSLDTAVRYGILGTNNHNDTAVVDACCKARQIVTCQEDEQQQQEQQNNDHDELNGQADAIRERYQKYQEDQYKHKDHVTARFRVTTTTEKTTTTHETEPLQSISLRSYVEHVDTKNGLSGCTQSHWQIAILTEQTAQIQGRIAWHVAYFEGTANVQTRVEKIIPSRHVSTAEEKVHAMVAAFEKSKLSYQQQLAKVIITDTIAKIETQLYDEIMTNFFSSSADDNNNESIESRLRQ
jgi:hypothetical protein